MVTLKLQICIWVELFAISSPQVQRSIRRYPHNGHVFTEISEKLRAHGYSRSPEQCHSRIKRLKSNYRQCRESIRLEPLRTRVGVWGCVGVGVSEREPDWLRCL